MSKTKLYLIILTIAMLSLNAVVQVNSLLKDDPFTEENKYEAN